MLLKRIGELQVLTMVPPSQNGTQEAGSSVPQPGSRASDLELGEVPPHGSPPAAVTLTSGLKATPIRLRKRLVDFRSSASSLLVVMFVFLSRFEVPSVVCSISMVLCVSFLNICICWAIAYFFNSPFPCVKLRNTSGSWTLFTKIKVKKKKREKKAKKYCERKKKQLNIFWINIWYFF